MDIYIGTSSTDRDFLGQLAQHIEAQGVHPARIEESWGVGMNQLTVECADYDAAEFDFRYNHRIASGTDDTERCAIALRGAAGKRLTYAI